MSQRERDAAERRRLLQEYDSIAVENNQSDGTGGCGGVAARNHDLKYFNPMMMMKLIGE